MYVGNESLLYSTHQFTGPVDEKGLKKIRFPL